MQIRKLFLTVFLFFPILASAHLISITPITAFPSAVFTSSSTTASFQVTNITAHTPLTVVDQSQFPSGSGLSITSSTCGNVMSPGQSCSITLQLQAPASAQTISTALQEWAKPSADGVQYPIIISVIAPYTITPNAGLHGAISPNTSVLAAPGSSVTFTASPASGYVTQQWLLDDSVVQTGGTTYTLSNITANHTLRVTFKLNIPITVGSYSVKSHNDSSSNTLPFAYTSYDNGIDWTLNSHLSIPDALPEGKLLGSACVNSTCIAVGDAFNTNGSIDIPLTYKSTDGGSTWTLSPTPSIPSGKTHGVLKGATCTNSACIAVGFSYDSDLDFLPVAYTSTDNGTSWVLSPAFSVPSGQINGELNAVTCNNNGCITVGYTTNTDKQPVAYTTTDYGSSWTVSPTFTLPSGAINGLLQNISCGSNNCVAVGYATNSNGTTSPLAYMSTNHGNSWTLLSTFTLPGGQTNGSLQGVTCKNTTCIAVGFSSKGSQANELPLAYVSRDSGNTWSLSSAFTLPSGNITGYLSNITYVGNSCVAVGSASSEIPIAFTSNDNGSTWTPSHTPSVPRSGNAATLSGAASTD